MKDTELPILAQVAWLLIEMNLNLNEFVKPHITCHPGESPCVDQIAIPNHSLIVCKI